MGKVEKGNTFSSIKLEPELFAEKDFDVFFKALLEKLSELKQQRFEYYNNLRLANTRWANGARWFLA